MHKLRLFLIIILLFGVNKKAHASDLWQVTKNYVIDNSRLFTAVAAVGAMIYYLLPDDPVDKNPAMNGLVANNRSRAELNPLLARQGRDRIIKNKEQYKANRRKVAQLPSIEE